MKEKEFNLSEKVSWEGKEGSATTEDIKEFIRLRNELDEILIIDLKLCTNEGAKAYCIEQHKKRRDKLAGDKLI